MEKQDKMATGNILTLLSNLSDIQQLVRHMAECPACITDTKQLERDLCTLKGNVFLLEIKIDHVEALLKGSK